MSVVENVNCLYGFRILLKTTKEWEKFCDALYTNAGVPRMDYRVTTILPMNDEIHAWNTFDDYFKKLFDGLKGVHYDHADSWCCITGQKVTIIDIGFALYDDPYYGINIKNKHDGGTCINVDLILDLIAKSKSPKFAEILRKSFLWDFCVNQEEPSQLFMADGDIND
jgi:hypothetical protein